MSDELRGEGVGHKLLNNIVEFAREKNVLIIALCPFAKAAFEKDYKIRDVLFT